MNLRYKIVFSVEILHDYYADKQCEDFEIIPSSDTAAVLKGQGMLFKIIGNKLLVLAKVNESGKPVIELRSSAKLTFFMKLTNPRFTNFTNLDYQPSESKK